MTTKVPMHALDRKQFLETYNFTDEQLVRTELAWSLLEQIYERHIGMTSELQTTATYISQRLTSVPAVHSLRVRIKDSEHLVEKIIRKKLERPGLIVELDSYEEWVTDLIGIRILHLFKNDWRTIHEFVTRTWELQETPIAYVRAGDPEGVIKDLNDAKFKVEYHPFGYRSIHYLIKSQPSKCMQLVELQVRTIFEEGWSEIDHTVRYPRQSDDPYLAHVLTIFNRLAGSADEMGTFIKALSSYIRDQSAKVAERERQITEKEDDLQKAVSQLKINEGEKIKLQKQIAELRKSSLFTEVPGFVGNASLKDLMSIGGSGWSNLLQKTCDKCGKRYTEPLTISSSSVISSSGVISFSNRCEDCRKAP
jgi:putative GTP pyrophosphokinase